MTHKSDLLAKLQRAIMDGDEEQAREAAQECLDAGIPPIEAVEAGLRDGLRIIGEQFKRLEVFLPEMIMAADASGRCAPMCATSWANCTWPIVPRLRSMRYAKG